MKRVQVITLLVAIDLATKFVALALLDPHAKVDESTAFQFVLRLNQAGFGSWAISAGVAARSSRLIAASCGWFVAGIAALVLRNRIKSKKLVVALCICGIIVGSVIGMFVCAVIGPNAQASLARYTRLGVLPLICVFVCMARSGLMNIVAGLFAAAGFGNSLSLVLPPFSVIDFMYSRAASGLLGQGVFNFADLYFDLALLGMVALIVSAPFRWMRRCRDPKH